MSSMEIIAENGKAGRARISICIPAWKDDARQLLQALSTFTEIEMCEVLVYDDGSNDETMTAAISASLEKIEAPAKLITAQENHGRSHARNRLISEAKADWLLMLDADMLPDSTSFLAHYMEAIAACRGPALITGGFSLKQVIPNQDQRLHAAQSIKSECVPANIRAKQPGLYVFTSNILVHRDILNAVQFDEAYTGWGWEDVDWGLRVAETFEVMHIENTATHLGLDSSSNLLRKYGASAANFARLANQHPEQVSKMRLYRMAKRLQKTPGRNLIKSLSRKLASANHGLFPLKLRLFGLKMFRAATYAEVLK